MFADADFGADKATSKSTSGVIVKIDDTLVEEPPSLPPPPGHQVVTTTRRLYETLEWIAQLAYRIADGRRRLQA